MKKVLLATAIAAMSTTAAMAEVSISDYQAGKVHALMTTANSFESRGINIVENSNKIAVHKTVNAWNQGWNAAEGNNTIDLHERVLVTTLVTTSHGVITTEASNISVSEDGLSAVINTGEGVSYEVLAANVQQNTTVSVSMRDSRADLVSMEDSIARLESGYNASEVIYSVGEGEVLAINAGETFDALVDKVEDGIQVAYDNGFSDGYTAGYDDGFAAAKGVVKN